MTGPDGMQDIELEMLVRGKLVNANDTESWVGPQNLRYTSASKHNYRSQDMGPNQAGVGRNEAIQKHALDEFCRA